MVDRGGHERQPVHFQQKLAIHMTNIAERCGFTVRFTAQIDTSLNKINTLILCVNALPFISAPSMIYNNTIFWHGDIIIIIAPQATNGVGTITSH